VGLLLSGWFRPISIRLELEYDLFFHATPQHREGAISKPCCVGLVIFTAQKNLDKSERHRA